MVVVPFVLAFLFFVAFSPSCGLLCIVGKKMKSHDRLDGNLGNMNITNMNTTLISTDEKKAKPGTMELVYTEISLRIAAA